MYVQKRKGGATRRVCMLRFERFVDGFCRYLIQCYNKMSQPNRDQGCHLCCQVRPKSKKLVDDVE